LHKKSWREDRGQRTEGRKEKAEDRKWIWGEPGYPMNRQVRFAATLRLAVWGVWAVYVDDEASEFTIYDLRLTISVSMIRY